MFKGVSLKSNRNTYMKKKLAVFFAALLEHRRIIQVVVSLGRKILRWWQTAADHARLKLSINSSEIVMLSIAWDTLNMSDMKKEKQMILM